MSMEYRDEPPPSRCVTMTGPVLGIMGAVFFVVGVVCVLVSSRLESHDMFVVGAIFLVFSFLFAIATSCSCSWCRNNITVHNWGKADTMHSLMPIDVPGAPTFFTPIDPRGVPPVRQSKMDLWDNCM